MSSLSYIRPCIKLEGHVFYDLSREYVPNGLETENASHRNALGRVNLGEYLAPFFPLARYSHDPSLLFYCLGETYISVDLDLLNEDSKFVPEQI